jgi:FkbM family methyltransferase
MKNFFLGFIKKIRKLFPASLIIAVYIFLARNKTCRRAIHAIIKFVMPRTVEIEEGIIVLNPEDPVVSGSLVFGVYEKFETELFRQHVKPGMVVVDVGANIGYYSLIAARRVGDTGKVFAFEPDSNNFAFLQQMVARNRFTNVISHNIALGDRDGSIDLYLSDDNKGDHRIYPVSLENRSKITIPMNTLDAVLKSGGSLHVDFLKMDVQGAEGLVLGGMPSVLSSNPNMIIFSEFWPEGLRDAGSDPIVVLEKLAKNKNVYEIEESKLVLKKVTDLKEFINRYPGRKYANIICKNG